LFLTSDGRLKVLDFGIARLRELTSANSPSATQAGSVLGTPAFMAPEQALGRWHEVDGRTDIWSVGATAFTLLTGQFVHQAETLQEQLVLSATRPARLLRDVRPSLPEGLAQVIDRALAFERDERFPHARAMRGALRKATGQVSLDSFTPVSPRIPESARVSTAADEHGATLVAPLDVTSAITGRSSSPTGRPVTRSTVISGGPRVARRQWPLVAAVVVLGLLGSALVLAVGHRTSSADPPPGSASLSPPNAPPSPDTARATPRVLSTSTPAVAAVLDAGSSVPTLPTVSTAAAVKHPPVILPKRVDHLAPTPTPIPNLSKPTVTKSLLGEDNPFDRRH
jgi:serine/threonine-protein kinase